MYFGGGTPSLVPIESLAKLMDAARALFEWVPDAEVTLETNPADLGSQDFDHLLALGINRLSLGWQSTRDDLLRQLGRRHSAAEAADTLFSARRAGFDNVSVDLIFAVPGQTRGDLEADLAVLEEAVPEHVSIYALTFHPDTPFARRRQAGELVATEEDLEVEMMECIDQRLTAAGYEHYEVSNFARAGFRARHNSSVWSGAAYLGIGPGAHSFVHEDWRIGWRWESIRDPQDYLRVWRDERAPGMPEVAETEWIEELTPRQLVSERMMLALRTSDGVELHEPMLARFANEVAAAAAEAVARGWAVLEAGRLRPTAEGFRHNDALAELFF
jgi:oxygen-independent coproporphyrinogen-3 oxidase